MNLAQQVNAAIDRAEKHGWVVIEQKWSGACLYHLNTEWVVDIFVRDGSVCIQRIKSHE